MLLQNDWLLKDIRGLIPTWDHCQILLSLQISYTQGTEFEPVEKMSSGVGKWSSVVMITTTPWHRKPMQLPHKIRIALESTSSSLNCSLITGSQEESVQCTFSTLTNLLIDDCGINYLKHIKQTLFETSFQKYSKKE